jgi:hypothetical protein
VLWAIVWYMARKINVNRFSLNGFYRNRLARAFLGAAREKRMPDPFTSFSPEDNIRLSALGTGKRALMPVVNVALNLVGGKRLAWQERKAQSFVFTPIACGSHELGEPADAGQPPPGPPGSYVTTEIYGGNEPDLGKLGSSGTGVSLATAIAISGAAASPSMGYHSSPATAFVMTLFNVRLGAWLPNPGAKLSEKEMMRSAPPNALRPLMEEMLGLTNADGQSVYLSDGGHFENLGLYEMARRRCRYIVVSDAGCDPEAGFEDLGGAIRKVRIDLGFDIDIDTVRIVGTKWKDKSTFFALGSIDYGNGEKGYLVYLKPSCPPSIPTDVRAYSLKSGTFPHESTGDQWFSESQFESYRKLGENLAEQLGEDRSYAQDGVPGFFADIAKGTQERSTKLDAIRERLEELAKQQAEERLIRKG